MVIHENNILRTWQFTGSLWALSCVSYTTVYVGRVWGANCSIKSTEGTFWLNRARAQLVLMYLRWVSARCSPQTFSPSRDPPLGSEHISTYIPFIHGESNIGVPKGVQYWIFCLVTYFTKYKYVYPCIHICNSQILRAPNDNFVLQKMVSYFIKKNHVN